MPGGRLTDQDRQAIASGLAEGLGYAEIARRLGRPTSTISREVARNGASGGYAAGRAQQVTAWRAHRRRPAPAEPPPALDSADGRDAEAVRSFLEKFVELIVQTGLQRMAARVFACLITSDAGACTAAELAAHLAVSPASVSKAVGYLEGLELIRRERDAGRRRELYLIDDDIWLQTWMTSARTNELWADSARQGAEILGATTPAGARLASMSRFFAQLSEDMSGGAMAVAFDDAMTVLAALVHAVTPRTVDELESALGWSRDRVTGALRDAEKRPDLTDPVVLQEVGAGVFVVAIHPDRLSAIQREALSRSGGAGVR